MRVELAPTYAGAANAPSISGAMARKTWLLSGLLQAKVTCALLPRIPDVEPTASHDPFARSVGAASPDETSFL